MSLWYLNYVCYITYIVCTTSALRIYDTEIFSLSNIILQIVHLDKGMPNNINLTANNITNFFMALIQ